MNDIKQVNSLLFDMDGTLWDGVEAYAQGFNDFFKANNINRQIVKNDISALMGWEQDKFLQAVVPEIDFSERESAYNQIIEFQYQRIESGIGMLYDGVREGLEKLSERYKLFIVSNCPEFAIEHFMHWAKIEHTITDLAAHGKNHKPKHENIRFLIEKHGLKHPFYIGDTDSDSKQSSLVPLPFIFVDYGFGETSNYTLRFSSFKQLSDYFLSE
jgi:phosphoglycolate phosphatase